MQRLDALGVFVVGRVQRIQLFLVDDVEETFVDHGQLEAQAALASALFWYFGNNPVQARWNLRADQPDVGVDQAARRIQCAGARVALLRRFRPSYSTEDPPVRLRWRRRKCRMKAMVTNTDTVKARARELIDQLPENATWDDVAYEVAVRRSIERGLADLEADRTFTSEALLESLGLSE